MATLLRSCHILELGGTGRHRLGVITKSHSSAIIILDREFCLLSTSGLALSTIQCCHSCLMCTQRTVPKEYRKGMVYKVTLVKLDGHCNIG